MVSTTKSASGIEHGAAAGAAVAAVAPPEPLRSPRVGVAASTSSASTSSSSCSAAQTTESEPYPSPHHALQRASGLLTTKGDPVPAIAQLHADAGYLPDHHHLAPPPPGTPSTQAGTHRRAHSSTVPSASSSPMAATETVSRRRSVAGTPLTRVGGSIRRGVIDASSFLAARKNRAPGPPRSDNVREWTFPLDGARSTNTSPQISSPSSESPHPVTATGSRPYKKTNTVGVIRRHFKSASDALVSTLQRPRPTHPSSDPSPLPPTPLQSTGANQSAPNLPPVEGVSLTALEPVQSPEEMSQTETQKCEDGELENGGGEKLETPQVATVTPTLNLPDTQPPTPISPLSPSAHLADVKANALLLNGTMMLKVSLRKQKQYWFVLDPDQGRIVWNSSKKYRIIPIECIKEIRTGADARYYREQFQLASSYEERWLTLVYLLDSEYKTLHLIAPTREIFVMWETAIRNLYDVRKKLMSGLGHGAMRQAIWEKQFWKGADGQHDEKLEFNEVEMMCRRMNVLHSREDLLRRFKNADSKGRGYLDFPDFRKFVSDLKSRPDVDRLFKKLVSESNSKGETLDFAAFESFMRKTQQSTLTEEELRRIFVKYASYPDGEGSPFKPPASPARNPLELAMQSAAITAGFSSPPLPEASHERDTPSDDSSRLSLSPPLSSSSPRAPAVPFDQGVWTSKAFTSFLLSPENSGFHSEQMDMTRPMSEYFISSSHNTYLVGHQLVGESTVEGYARALLHGCRSVEVDIYDGETEPVIYHGKTLTTRVPLRDICATIARYAFVTSPYAVIISAEVHCCVAQQAMVASVMSDVFGDALVRAPEDGRPRIEVLPSPEDLKGKVLLKTKDLYVSSKDDKELPLDTESSSADTSASETDLKDEIKHEWRKARANEAEAIKGLKSELSKAKDVLKRVKSRRGSDNPAARPLLTPPTSPPPGPGTVKMAYELVALLVYTVGVKCRGLNKKEVYAPEHMFSLSEKTANRMLRQGVMTDLIKHCRTHLVRIYPKGTRFGSTNYEPHRYWSAGAQLVAINWQTFDLGYMINHAMFQRNDRAGYVLKPLALRSPDKTLLSQRSNHFLDIKIISAQQLPRRKDALGREIMDKSVVDPYVEISLHIPDWTSEPFTEPGAPGQKQDYSPPSGPTATRATSARTVTVKTTVVKNNGWNPVWEEKFSLPFDCVGGMMDLIFVKFAVKQEDEDEVNLAVYCTSLASLYSGYRHLPLHDAQLSQYLFSTLFVKTSIRTAAVKH